MTASDRRGLLRGRARRLAPAQLRQRGSTRPTPRTCPSRTVATPQWTPCAHHRLGREDRAVDRRARRARSCRSAASRAGLPLRLGIMRLATLRRRPVEAACARALAVRAYSYRVVESILKHGLDRQPLPGEPPPRAPSPPPQRARARLLPLKGGHRMLNNTTIEGLHALRLPAWPPALAEQASSPTTRGSASRSASGCSSTESSPSARTGAWSAISKAAKLRMPAVVEDIDFRRPRGSTGPDSQPRRGPLGARPTTPCSSSARPGRQDLPRLRPRPRGDPPRATPRSTCAPRGCSTSSPSPALTAALPAHGRPGPASTSS